LGVASLSPSAVSSRCLLLLSTLASIRHSLPLFSMSVTFGATQAPRGRAKHYGEVLDIRTPEGADASKLYSF
jgi:hypothetical protein